MTAPLVLPYPPSGNRYWRHVGSRVLVSAEARAYKARVGWICMGKKLRPLQGPVVVTVAVYRPAKRGDLDNTLKVLLDSLRGYLFVDDAQVVEIHASRSEDRENPRAELRVASAQPQHVPGDGEQADK